MSAAAAVSLTLLRLRAFSLEASNPVEDRLDHRDRLVLARRLMADEHRAELIGNDAQRGDGAGDVVGDDRRERQWQQAAAGVEVHARLAQLGQADPPPQRPFELGQIL